MEIQGEVHLAGDAQAVLDGAQFGR